MCIYIYIYVYICACIREGAQASRLTGNAASSSGRDIRAS